MGTDLKGFPEKIPAHALGEVPECPKCQKVGRFVPKGGFWHFWHCAPRGPVFYTHFVRAAGLIR